MKHRVGMVAFDYVTVSQDQLDRIIDALKMSSKGAAISRSCIGYQKTIAEHGWSEEWRFEDFLLTLDRRIGLTHLDRPAMFRDQFEFERHFAFSQHFDPDEGPIGREMYRAATVACYLVWLERLGFDVDPSLLCSAISSQLPSDRFVTGEELVVLEYQEKRHAMAPVTVASDNVRCPSGQTTEFVTERDYRILVQCDAHGTPVSLEVHAPNYIEPRPQVVVKCEECQMEYVSGIRSDEHHHDIEHRKIVTTLKPVPSRALKRTVMSNPGAIWVTPESPSWACIAVYRRARAFKREMGYDFVQWDTTSEPDAIGFLFHDSEFRIVGACCFRPARGEKSATKRLDWIWICPDQRRTGILTKNWDLFRQRFGEFEIEEPISDAMKAFLRKEIAV